MIFNLYRNKEKKIFSGLCAGISDVTGINVLWIRIIWIFSTFISFSFSFWLYILLSLLIPAKKELKIPKNLPKELKNDLISIKNKILLIQKNCNREIFNTAQLTFEKLTHFISSINSKHNSSNYLSIQKSLINKFNDLIDNQLLMKKNNVLLDLLDDLRNKSNYLLNDTYNYNLEQLNNKDKILNWIESIYPLKLDFLLKSDEKIINLFLEIENKIIYLLQYVDSPDLSIDTNYNLKKIANDYLPETIQNYLKLYDSAINNPDLLNKAVEQLIEQLKKLESALNELQNEIYQNYLNKMKLHGQFLKEKFN